MITSIKLFLLLIQLIKYILIILKFNSIITYMDLTVNTYL